MARLLAALALLLFPALLRAQDAPIPPGVRTIDAEGLKGMRDGGAKLVLINTLSALEFTQTKIAGSVNHAYGHLRDGEDALPADKETTLVFYCLGPK